MGKIDANTRFLRVLLLSIILLGGLLNCGKNDSIIIEKPTKVLEKPYPENYPSTKPKANKVLTVLEKGERVQVLKEEYGKDFLVYKIQLENGKTGYIVYEKDAFRTVSGEE